MRKVDLCAIGSPESISGGFLYHKWIAGQQEEINLKFFRQEDSLVEYLAQSKNVLLIDAWALHDIALDQLPLDFYLLVHHPIALDKQVIGDELKEEALWNLAKGIVVTGAEVYHYITSRTKSPVILIEPGINSDHYGQIRTVPKFEKEPDTLTLLGLGGVIPRKGDQLLIGVLSKLEFDFELIRIGPSPDQDYLAKLQGLAREIGVYSKINWVLNAGELEKRSYLINGDLALFPTSYESYGMAIQECLAQGIPVFSSDLPALKDRFGTIGIRYFPLDTESWKAAIERFNTDQLFREVLIKEAEGRSNEFPSWDKQKELLMNFIDELESARN